MNHFPEATFVPIPPEDMPHDPHGTAPGWSFRTLEHDEMNSPRALEATDGQGRSAIYTAFPILPPDQRPQDDAPQTGGGLTFKTLDHDELGVPHSIIATDVEGRAAAYLPLMEGETIGRWK